MSVLTRVPLYSEEIFDRKTMIQVQRALIGVTEDGTASYLKSRYTKKTFAGKTGTTNDLRDSWFAGFSNRYLTVVWLGDDDNRPINLSGSSGALRVWAHFMARASQRSLGYRMPDGIETHWVDSRNGYLTGEGCPESRLLPFIAGSQPRERTNCSPRKSGIKNWFQSLFD